MISLIYKFRSADKMETKKEISTLSHCTLHSVLNPFRELLMLQHVLYMYDPLLLVVKIFGAHVAQK